MGRLNNGFLEAHNFTGDVLIETGTFNGRGMKLCHGMFAECHTVELDPARYEKSKARLASIPNVTCHVGHSPVVLVRIMDASKRTVFWLDAHYVATDPAAHHVAGQCPLMEELAVIFGVPWVTKPTILIDDARMFVDENWSGIYFRGYDQDQWPKRQEIIALAKANGYGLRQIRDVLILEAAECSGATKSNL